MLALLRQAPNPDLPVNPELAGLRLRHRWSDWSQAPFTAASGKQVSVYERSGSDNLHKFGILANGSASPNGRLDFGHYHLRVLGDGTMSQAVVRTERSDCSPGGRSQK